MKTLSSINGLWQPITLAAVLITVVALTLFGFLRSLREITAQAALKRLLGSQRQDLDSFSTRAELHIAALDRARIFPDDTERLTAATNMFKSFLASAQLFRDKWLSQIEAVKAKYPAVKAANYFDLLAELEQLPGQLAERESLLQIQLGTA